MKREDDFEKLTALVNSDKVARTARIENNLRRNLGEILDNERIRQGLSIRDLAKELETSISQVQRVLHREVGGNLTLKTLVRAADALMMVISVNIRQKEIP
jgi:ribosome-binding protein aMBF1 (putative translation factor)